MGNHIKKPFFLKYVSFAALGFFAKQVLADGQPPFPSLTAFTPPPVAPPLPGAAPDVFNMGGSPVAGPPVPMPPPGALAPNQFEKCYGVAGKNQNHCAYVPFDGGKTRYAGDAKACDPAAWRWVPAGLCRGIVVGADKGGKMIMGLLAPSSERTMPEICHAYDPQDVPKNDKGL